MLKENRELFKVVNKMLREWDEEGITNNRINLVKDQLQEVYKKYGKNVVEEDRFSYRVKLPIEGEEELMQIAYNMAYDPTADVDYYKDIYEETELVKIQNKYGYDDINVDAFKKMKEQYPEYFQDLEDYVHYFDRINNFKNDKLLSSILSSKQYVNLMNYGRDDIDENELDSIIVNEYMRTGMESYNLYDKVLELIS